MPTLQFKGKNIIWNHHLSIPYHTLDEVEKLNFNEEKSNGNLIIEGDNLLALKALLPQYAGKIKCIYIDPPYNTGNENWIYNDNVNNPMLKEWLGKEVGKEDLTRHDKWLCMMVPRLKLLWELLSEDGVLLISIDDNEQHTLHQILNEIYGEDKFISQLIWNTEGHTDNQYHVKVNHESVLLYVKNSDKIEDAIGYIVDPNTREESNLWKGYAENSITKNGPANPASEVSLPKGFPCEVENLNIEMTKLDVGFYNEVEKLGYISRDITTKYNIDYPIKKNKMIVKDFKLDLDCVVYSGWANVNKLRKFIENNFNPLNELDGQYSFYLSKRGVIYYKKEREKARNILSVLRNFGTTESQRSELEKDGVKFQYPKPLQLIKYLIRMGTLKQDAIILDSFAGSGTTMHAVMDLNKKDEGNRKCILIQMPEATESDPTKNICKDITRERIKRAIDKYGYDTGFKYLKVGIPIDAETMLSGNLPTYMQFADYVYYLCTGESLKDKKSIDEKNYFVGEHSNSLIYLIYKQNFDELTRMALNLVVAEKIIANHPKKRIIVYAPACFLEEDYMKENSIEYVGIPYNLFQRSEA